MGYGIMLLSAEEQKTLKPVLRIMNTVLKSHELSKTNDADDELRTKTAPRYPPRGTLQSGSDPDACSQMIICQLKKQNSAVRTSEEDAGGQKYHHDHLQRV